uniref:Uncharacterized protein n=1 Tax=Anopheles dirus TaxID=7168 RepID=A0A182NJK8_9DIPT
MTFFEFDFMGGDAKSPQHTAVHPMYVSYSSLPTTNSANSTQLKQAASSAKLLQLTNGGSGGIGGVGGGEEGDGGTGGVGLERAPPSHARDRLPSSLSPPLPPPSNPAAGAMRNNSGGSFGDVLKAKLNGHAAGGGPPSNSNHHSPSNTNTLLSSSSSPSSTFTNIHSSPQSLHNAHNNNSNNNNSNNYHHHHHHHNLHHQNSTSSQQGNMLTKLSSTNSINSGGSRVILLQHQDSSESSPPPTVPVRGLSRNASFSKATSSSGGGARDHATVLNNNPLRKNSSAVSILRYGDGVQGRRTPDPEDDTFFIPRSASSYQARAGNFGISNPFNNVIMGRPGGYRGGTADGGTPGEDDGRRLLLLSGSAQQLGSSTPQKRNSLVGVPSGSAGPATPGSWNGRGSPVVPQVPPLPQHYQRKNSSDAGAGPTANNAYLTRSPNLNRIARRHNGGASTAAASGGNNAINNNGHAGGFLERGAGGGLPGSRSGSSGRLPSTANQCDQIREYGGPVGKPLGYCAAAVPSSPPGENNNFPVLPGGGARNGITSGIPVMVMHRAKSQDRLAYRSRRPGRAFGAGGSGSGGGSSGHHHHHHHQQQQRPRSFCSNNGAYPDYVILEHPGN